MRPIRSAAFLFGPIYSCIIGRSRITTHMFCIKCGKENADDALYCQKCGGAFAAEEETQVAVRGSTGSPTVRDDDPPAIFSITPTMKFVFVGYIVTVLAAFLVVVVLTMFLPGLSPVFAVVIGLP